MEGVVVPPIGLRRLLSRFAGRGGLEWGGRRAREGLVGVRGAVVSEH